MTNVNVKLKQQNICMEKHSRLPFYLGMALMIFAIFARNILDLPIPVIAILAIGALVAVISDRDEIIALAIACIPMSAAFQYKYLLFICIIVYVVKFGKDIKITSAVLPLAFMVVWEFIHGLFYPFSIYESLRGFSELIFCTFLMMVVPKKVDYKMISRLLAIASICMMSIVILNLLEKANYNFEEVFVGSYRFGVGNTDAENFGVNYNANALGMIANLSIAGLLQLIAAKKHNLFDYFMIVVLVMFGVMTMSRAFLICFALIIAMFAVSGVPTLKGKVKRIFLIILMIVLLVMLVVNLMPTVYETFVARFEVEDISNGRNDLFMLYLDHITANFKNLMFGIGRQGYGDIIENMYPDVALGTGTYACHNGTQELLVCWGIPGLVLFVWFIVEMIRKKPIGLKRSLVNYIPLILLLVYVQSGQLITGGASLLALTFAYVSLCYDFSFKETK